MDAARAKALEGLVTKQAQTIKDAIMEGVRKDPEVKVTGIRCDRPMYPANVDALRANGFDVYSVSRATTELMNLVVARVPNGGAGAAAASVQDYVDKHLSAEEGIVISRLGGGGRKEEGPVRDLLTSVVSSLEFFQEHFVSFALVAMVVMPDVLHELSLSIRCMPGTRTCVLCIGDSLCKEEMEEEHIMESAEDTDAAMDFIDGLFGTADGCCGALAVVTKVASYEMIDYTTQAASWLPGCLSVQDKVRVTQSLANDVGASFEEVQGDVVGKLRNKVPGGVMRMLRDFLSDD